MAQARFDSVKGDCSRPATGRKGEEMIDTSIYRVICDGQVECEWTRFTAAMDHAKSLTGDVQIEQDGYTRDGYKCTFILYSNSEISGDPDRFE